jgi:hypothetical protein
LVEVIESADVCLESFEVSDVEGDCVEAGSEVHAEEAEGRVEEAHERAIVGGADAVVQPLAVVVEVVDATVALRAVLRARQAVGLAQVAEVQLELLCQV